MGEREIYRDFGRKLAVLRNEAGLTQAGLARKIGMSRASLANIERGEQRVYLHQFLSVLSALGRTKLEDLLPAEGPAQSKPKADVTVSGDKLSKAQERAIKELVSSITATSRRMS
jgi:transcriptional regulator with XRE-family HTH domain